MQNRYGETALDVADSNGNIEAAKLLREVIHPVLYERMYNSTTLPPDIIGMVNKYL